FPSNSARRCALRPGPAGGPDPRGGRGQTCFRFFSVSSRMSPRMYSPTRWPLAVVRPSISLTSAAEGVGAGAALTGAAFVFTGAGATGAGAAGALAAMMSASETVAPPRIRALRASTAGEHAGPGVTAGASWAARALTVEGTTTAGAARRAAGAAFVTGAGAGATAAGRVFEQ